MTYKYYKILYLLTGVLLLFQSCTEKSNDWVSYVDPLIGTAPSTTISALKHGHGSENNAQVVPYVTVPFGMTNWTPQTRATENKCVAPYYYTDSILSGFRGSHWLSGSCVQDYASMTIMPVSGELKCLADDRASAYSHQNELSSPYFYSVHLDDYNVDAEVTATKRCGLFRFTFNKNEPAHIIVNPNSDEGQGFVKLIPENNEIVGYNPAHRIYQGWGENAGFCGYFVVRFHEAFDDYGVYQAENIFKHDTQVSDLYDLGAYVSFSAETQRTVYVSIGTSFTSVEQARKNLDIETQNMSFDNAKEKLKNNWNQLLGRVEVEGKKEEDKVKFYTALYHSLLHPRTFNDCDGAYPAFANDQMILNANGEDYYVDFSMWDTYRASHPLFNLLVPKQNAQMMSSLFKKAKQGEWLPIFPCWNNYTSAMIGDHVIATVADAYSKGIIDISDEQYQYLLKNAFETPESFAEYKGGKGRRALNSYMQLGYIPLEDKVNESYHKNEQVSRTLEYAYDDFALYTIAQKRGDTKTMKQLKKRAFNYKNVFSVKDSCVRARYKDGAFIEAFDKYNKVSFITEGTPYQYTWYVPQDMAGLIQLMGGEAGFNRNLDHFHASGQYWHGNEPGHQIPFLYNYSGQPWKTQALVADIMKTEYGTGPGGLSGNDDAGQMSAWYVFAAMGFYPVCPSVDEYVISGPRFDKLKINLDNGNQLEIRAEGASEGKKYIRKLTLNGEEIERNYFTHNDLINGGIIEFEMSDKPHENWGVSNASRPFSISTEN